MKCDKCDDTGSLQKSLYGDLDCPHCDAAALRTRLNQWTDNEAEQGEALHWCILRAALRGDFS